MKNMTETNKALILLNIGIFVLSWILFFDFLDYPLYEGVPYSALNELISSVIIVFAFLGLARSMPNAQGRWITPIHTVLLIIMVYGAGAHAAANSIHGEVRGEDVIYIWDEILGHSLSALGLYLAFLSFPILSIWYPVKHKLDDFNQFLAAGLGAINALITIPLVMEAQITYLTLCIFLPLTGYVLYKSRRDIWNNEIELYYMSLAVVLVGGIFMWAAMFGGFVEPSAQGLFRF